MSRFYVVCDDFESKHETRERAEQRKALIEQLGHCRLPHHIEERLR